MAYTYNAQLDNGLLGVIFVGSVKDRADRDGVYQELQKLTHAEKTMSTLLKLEKAEELVRVMGT